MTSPAKDSSRRIFTPLRAVGAFVVACGIGIGGYLFSTVEPAPAPDRVVRIDNMVTNLAGGSMVRLSVSVLLSPDDKREIAEDLTRDAVIGELRKVGKADLDGYHGLEALKSSILAGLKEAVGQDVKEVLIREFVVNG